MEFKFLNDIISNKPLLALIYILSSIIIAYIVDKIFIASLKLLVKKSDTEIDDKILDFIHKPIYYSILFFGISIAIGLLEISSKINFYLIGIMKSIIIVFWAIALFKSFMIFIEWSSKKSRTIPFIQPKTIPLFENMGKIILFLFSIYFVMLSWNIDVTAWIASAGIISVVIGLAAKDTLGNLFAGIFIMADSPYKEGDYINLDTGERGSVRHIGTRSTRILTRDDIEITIPNSVIATSKIINESGGPHEKERIRITLDVAYGSDIEKVKDIMLNLALASNEVCDNPKPRVRFRNFGESGLNLQLLCWIERPELRGRVIDELSISIYKNFNKENIEIPFPQRTVHLKKSE
tara:strand:- start:213 stop:1262 length:1050 start_codon:yes stop_codon:yes gene_type:complete